MIYLEATAEPAAEVRSAELDVLTYNVRGLPWPVASGRAEALREIGRQLAQLRAQGRQPDVVLIQEGFRGEIADLFKASGYAYWEKGPTRHGLGKLTGSGLHVLSDLPITEVKTAAFHACAGLDCLANKGAMLARVAIPGSPLEIDVVNTHMNTKRKARAPLAETLAAHKAQTDELIDFVSGHRDQNAPLLVGGDFNVKNAPDRYAYRAGERPYEVVSEFCNAPASGCDGQAPAKGARPWLKSQDLQGFEGAGVVAVRPTKVASLFTAEGPGGRLSDHDGYLVRYRLSWNPAQLAAAQAPRRSVEVRPKLGRGLGFKVSWKR